MYANLRRFPQLLYMLPPQIPPCDYIDLSNLRYLNTDFAPVKHPFKDNFNIERYNSMWLDNISRVFKPKLKQICGKDIIHVTSPAKLTAVENSTALVQVVALPSPVIVPRPNIIEEMDTNLHDNIINASILISISIVEHLAPKYEINLSDTHQAILASVDKLFFISYREENTLRPRWYLVQIRLDDDETPGANQYFVNLFRKHFDDDKKKDDLARYYHDWYEIEWADKEKWLGQIKNLT